MRWVMMRHDGVEGAARVPESAVPQMTHAGWTEVPDPGLAPEAPSTPPGGEPGTATSRRRAGQTGDRPEDTASTDEGDAP